MERLKVLVNSSDIHQLKLFKFNSLKNINEVEFKDFDLLVYAIETNVSNQTFKFIINEYKCLNYELENGLIPLFIAIENKFWSKVELLLAHKADINFCNKRGENVLFYLLNNDKLDNSTLSYLLRKNINLGYEDREGKTFLERVIEKNNENFVRTVCHHVVYNNDFVLSLIKNDRYKICLSRETLETVLIREKQKIQMTPSMFHRAIENNNLNILKILLSYNTNQNIFDRCNGY
ncbi:ankyrin repeat-containing domain protein, partial [Neocallimastix sp. 'constans']